MLMRKTYLSMLLATLSVGAIVPEVSAAKGFNFGLDYGQAEASKFCSNITPCDSADASAKADIGYQFTDFLGVEAGYVSFGTIFDSTDNQFSASQKSNALTASVLGTIPISSWFGVYGRAGIAQYESKGSGTVQTVPVKDEKGTTPFWGAGVKFTLSKHFAVRAEYQNYSNISRVDGKKDDVQGIYGGVVFSL